MLVELELILLAVEVLPIVLLLIVVVPAVELLFIPVKLFASVEEPVARVNDPIMLFSQSTVPVPVMFIAITFVPLAPPVNVTDPVPVAAPKVLPVLVPIFTVPPETDIPVHAAEEEFDQSKFFIILF